MEAKKSKEARTETKESEKPVYKFKLCAGKHVGKKDGKPVAYKLGDVVATEDEFLDVKFPNKFLRVPDDTPATDPPPFNRIKSSKPSDEAIREARRFKPLDPDSQAWKDAQPKPTTHMATGIARS